MQLRQEIQPYLDKDKADKLAPLSDNETTTTQTATPRVSPKTKRALYDKYQSSLDQIDAPFYTHTTRLLRGLSNKSRLARFLHLNIFLCVHQRRGIGGSRGAGKVWDPSELDTSTAARLLPLTDS